MIKEIPASNREEKYLDIDDDEFLNMSFSANAEEKLDIIQPQANTAAEPVSPAPAKENILPNQPNTTKPTPPKEPKNSNQGYLHSKRKYKDLSSNVTQQQSGTTEPASPSIKGPSWVQPTDTQEKQDNRFKAGS